MYQGYGQQPVRAPQNYFSMQPQQTALKGRPVSSLEEVRATGIDFDGSVFYFPDIANKRIYTKQIGMDGTAILNMYEQKPLPQEAPAGPVSIAIAINGEPVQTSTMIVTPAAVNEYFNVYRSMFLDVPRGCCSQISVENLTEADILVQNANLTIERVA